MATLAVYHYLDMVESLSPCVFRRLSPSLPATASLFSERQYRFPYIAKCGHPRKKKKNKKRLALAGEGLRAVRKTTGNAFWNA